MKIFLITAALVLASVAHAQTPTTFKRPDCSIYSSSLKPERACVRETKEKWKQANFAALQKTGLMFTYMPRPDSKNASDAVKTAFEKEIEGSFVLRFSVNPDGTVYDVQTVEVTEGIQPLAKFYADAIRQWTFAKTPKPVTGIEYRRIFMYTKEDDGDKHRRDPEQTEEH